MSAATSGVKLERLEHQTAPLRNKIITALRSAIETGMLQPGARLVERDLCEQLNVSRTSLREALRQLQAEGVLSHTAHRGLVVSANSREEAVNVYRIRAVLEALVVEQFVERADAAAFAELAEEAELLKKAYRSGVVERIIAGKRAFYSRICMGAGNELAFDIINRLSLRTASLRSNSLARKPRQVQSIKEICVLVEAVVARDVAAAKAAATRHVENAQRSAFEALDAKETVPVARRARVAG